MAKPKMAMIPSTVGGSVYSVLPSNGDGDFNFSRASAATRINAQGLIETVAVGDNRLNYPLLDGTVQTCPHLLLEPQRTNLLTYSESFSNAAWVKYRSSISSNNAISPDGTLNADKLVDSSDNNTHAIEEQVSGLINGSDYTYSIFAKAAEIKQIGILGSNPNQGTVFDLEKGIVLGSILTTPNSSKMEYYGNGWYKCIIVGTLNNTNTKFGVYLYKDESNTYIGNGTDGLYIYGAQLEQGSYSTSYIVSNSGSATTRIAEVCNGSGNASTFNDSEGVLMAQIGALADDGTSRYISLSDGTNSNRINIFLSTSNTLKGLVRPGTGSIESNVNILLFNKVAYKYKSGDNAFWVNGFKVGINSETTIPSGLNDLSFDLAGSQNFYGKTKQLQYFDSALTDSELETLTSWMSFSDMAIDLNYTIQ